MKGASKGHKATLTSKIMKTAVDRDKWWPTDDGGEHEVAFALHLYTLEVRWFKGDKKKGDKWKARFYVDQKWITGTADWKRTGPLLIVIDDLKTGRWPVDAGDNKQLMTYALPFWVAMGCPLDCEVVLSITQWPKYPLAGEPARNVWGCTGLNLAAHLQDLRYSLEHPEEANPDRESCMFCDCKPNCPAFMASGIDYTRS